MLHQLIAHLLVEVRAAVAKLRQAQQNVLDEVEAVDIILHAHIERRGDGALLPVAANVQVAVMTAVGQLMNERRVAVEGEDDRLILGKQHVVLGVGQAVRMLPLGLQLHQVNHVDHANLEFGQLFPQDGYGSQRFERRRLAAARHNNVRFCALIVGRPLPDADALGAVLHSLLHGQPLRTRMLGSHDDVDIVAALDAVIEAAEQAVCIGRQVQTDNIRLFVGDVVKETRVLMGKAVVVLLPYVGSQNQVERRDRLTPRQAVADLEPLGVLCRHRVDNADERLIACEKAVTAGQQIALKPTLAHVLGQHAVHHAAACGQEFVGVQTIGVPLAVGDLENVAQAVGHGLVRAEYAEVAAVHVQLDDIADISAKLDHILTLNTARSRNIQSVIAEIRQAQLVHEQTAVGVRVCADAVLAGRRQRLEFGNQLAVFVEQLLRMVAAQPLLEHGQVLRAVHHQRHLMRAEAALDLLAVHVLRAGPALRGAQHDHRVDRTGRVAGLAGVLADGEDFLGYGVERVRQCAVYLHRLIALDEIRLPAAALEHFAQLLFGNTRQQGRVGDLVAVQVQDRQNNAVRHRIEELVAVPRGCQRAGLRLAVTDNHGCDQVGVIQHRTEAVRQRITQFTALVDGARGLRSNVAGNAARERELLEQALHALGVLADVRVNLAVSALKVGVRHEEIAAVTRTGQQDHIQIILLDDAVQMNINQVLTGHRAPVADDLLLDVLGLQRLLEQRVIEQVKLTGCKIICRPPVCVHFIQHFVVDVCCHSVMLPFCD